jgi:hypothetical protein
MQGYDAAYYCQAMLVNIKLMKPLADELPTFAMPDWDARTANYMRRLQVALLELEQRCQTMYAESSDTMTKNVIHNHIFDVNTSIAIIYTRCHLLERTIPRHDIARPMLDTIKTYAYDIREIIEECLMALREDE